MKNINKIILDGKCLDNTFEKYVYEDPFLAYAYCKECKQIIDKDKLQRAFFKSVFVSINAANDFVWVDKGKVMQIVIDSEDPFLALKFYKVCKENKFKSIYLKELVNIIANNPHTAFQFQENNKIPNKYFLPKIKTTKIEIF